MPAPLFMSSGDLVADRRFDFARDLMLRGDLFAAADVLEQTVDRAPAFASAWFMLGGVFERLNQHGRAVAAYRRARDCDPHDRHGAAAHLMRLGALPLGDLPRGYVRALFDQFAPRFDQSLVDDLHYCGPRLLRDAVTRVCATEGRAPRFARAIDLGCGTGLAAAAFSDLAGEFVGVDLSPAMLARAEAGGRYARLVCADMTEAVFNEGTASASLVLAADAFVYVGDLAPALAECARVLEPGGILAFTVETHGGADVILKSTLRYGHGEAAVRGDLARAGLRLLLLEARPARHEQQRPVPGLVAVAMKEDGHDDG